MSWSEPQDEASNPLAQPDLVIALEQEIAAGFPPGLALDLVLNELVVRAATATRAHAAALALKRDDEMVCRAATGEHAPDLGIPLNTSDGVSGACLRTRKSQLCLDTETDPRVDAATCRRQGIRSMLVVPVLDHDDLVGVLEVFATQPAEFVDSDQNLLEIFARECNRIRRAALELGQRLGNHNRPNITVLPASTLGLDLAAPPIRKSYEVWTLIVGALAIVLISAFSFVIGSRIGWFGHPPVEQIQPPASPSAINPRPTAPSPPRANPTKSSDPKELKSRNSSPADAGGLVVYDQGKVVFRMKPVPANGNVRTPDSEAGSPEEIARVWLAADLAESRLVHRVEPQYPAEALSAHRSGDVVLEVLVNSDGTVASMRPLRGDPLLATAASDAVRSWRYEPYRVKGKPAEFQTDVTLKFSLPD
jgi:TonB family protein